MPTARSEVVSRVIPTASASPKSRTMTRPSRATMMFRPVTSRWITPNEWAWASASAAAAAMRTTSAIGISRRDASSETVSPSISA